MNKNRSFFTPEPEIIYLRNLNSELENRLYELEHKLYRNGMEDITVLMQNRRLAEENSELLEENSEVKYLKLENRRLEKENEYLRKKSGLSNYAYNSIKKIAEMSIPHAPYVEISIPMLASVNANYEKDRFAYHIIGRSYNKEDKNIGIAYYISNTDLIQSRDVVGLLAILHERLIYELAELYKDDKFE